MHVVLHFEFVSHIFVDLLAFSFTEGKFVKRVCACMPVSMSTIAATSPGRNPQQKLGLEPPLGHALVVWRPAIAWVCAYLAQLARSDFGGL